MVGILRIFAVTICICILSATAEKSLLRRKKIRHTKAESEPIHDKGHSDIPGLDAIIDGIGGDVDPGFVQAAYNEQAVPLGPCRPVPPPVTNKKLKRKDKSRTKDNSKAPNKYIFPLRFGWDMTPNEEQSPLPPCPPKLRGRADDPEYYDFYEDGSPTPAPAPEPPKEDCDNTPTARKEQTDAIFPRIFGWVVSSLHDIAGNILNPWKDRQKWNSEGKPRCNSGRQSPRHIPIKLLPIWDDIKPAGVFAGIRDKLQDFAFDLKKGFQYDLKPHEHDFSYRHEWNSGSQPQEAIQGGKNYIAPLFPGGQNSDGGEGPFPQAPEDIQPPLNELDYSDDYDYDEGEDMTPPEYASDNSYSEGGSFAAGKTWLSGSAHVRTNLEQPEARFMPLKELWMRPGKHVPKKRKPKPHPTHKFHILKPSGGDDAPV